MLLNTKEDRGHAKHVQFAESTFHNLAVRSTLAVATTVPSRENFPDPTAPLWPCNTPADTPVCACHNRAVLSSDVVKTNVLSGEKMELFTPRRCPSKACKHSPELMSHSRLLLSSEAAMAQSPSDEKSVPTTEFQWPRKT